MKSELVLGAVVFIIATIYVSAFKKAGIWLVKADEPIHSDAIVLLMGSITDRVLQTNDLYQSGYAEKVIIVEESMGT